MARRSLGVTPSKFNITAADIKAATGARALTNAEARRLGVSLRTYTTQKAGVKKLDKSKLISRRQARKNTLSTLFGSGKIVTPEYVRKEYFAERGGRFALGHFQQIREKYVEQKYGAPKVTVSKSGKVKKTYINAESGQEVRLSSVTLKSDKEFAKAYKDVKLLGDDRVSTVRRLTALYTLTGDEYYKRLLQRYFQ
jgi:hypothetical protein